MKYFFYKEKKGNKKIIYFLGFKITYPIIKTKCVFQKKVEDNKKSPLDIFVVTFNNAKITEYQIKLLKKFIDGNYVLTIVDNSTQKQQAEKIAEICDKYNISYYKIKQSGTIDPSRSHGDCLDWIYKNIIKVRKNNFCFLDHDLFPFKKIDINKYIPTKFTGIILEKDNKWFIWPGFAFFNYNYLKNKEVCFAPSSKYKLDTGGTLYETIYQYEDKKTIKQSVKEKIIINANKYSNTEQSTSIDFIDSVWVHTICGSQWVNTYGKQEKVYKIIDELLAEKNMEEIIKNYL